MRFTGNNIKRVNEEVYRKGLLEEFNLSFHRSKNDIRDKCGIYRLIMETASDEGEKLGDQTAHKMHLNSSPAYYFGNVK
jgi:hypothetical protein